MCVCVCGVVCWSVVKIIQWLGGYVLKDKSKVWGEF